MRDGSYSIEASIIMPIVLLITITFLMIGFYIRDIIFVDAYARSMLTDYEDNGEELVEYSDSTMRVQECMWCSEVENFRLYENSDMIKVEYKLKPKLRYMRLSVNNVISVRKKEKTSEKIYRWRNITDTVKNLFLTEG